jgi:protein-L-isoaspartate(D-aspartate) O-methyltransferase
MIDYTEARNSMVERQLVFRGIRDRRVLAAMREVPRHFFVDEALRDEAYDDTPLPIGNGQTISQPYMVAIMTELLDLQGDEIVLEIGTGSGYQAAVLSLLAKWVYTIERHADLSERAQKALKEFGYDNVTLVVGDGTQGKPDTTPYHGIVVTAGAPEIPKVLIDQLAESGKLVIPVGDRFSQTLKRVVKTPAGPKVESFTGCRFVDLVGKYGW